MQITIIDTAIRQDEHGRYSLNDLHRAAGGEKRHQPANFMRADGVEAFIAELDSTPQNRGVPSVNTVNGGKSPGTYASELVVYRYAAWISPAFEVKVYSTFRDWARGAADREIDGQPMTTSRKVAARFKKAHKTVLQSIKRIEVDQPDFYRLNFQPVIGSYPNGKGGMQKRTVIRMTKDGFTFLSMGFTGKDAAAWKIVYINAFNRMAEEIAKAAHVPAVPLTLHEQALKLHAESKTSEALGSMHGRGLRKRRDEKPVFAQQIAMMERALQLCLALGLSELPAIE